MRTGFIILSLAVVLVVSAPLHAVTVEDFLDGSYTNGVAPGWVAWTGSGACGPPSVSLGTTLGPPADSANNTTNFQQVSAACAGGNRGGVYRDFVNPGAGTYIVTCWVKVPNMGTSDNGWFELHVAGYTPPFTAATLDGDGNGFVKWDNFDAVSNPNPPSTGTDSNGWIKYKSKNITLTAGQSIRFWTKHGGAGASQTYAIDYVALLQMDASSQTDTLNGTYTGGVAPGWTVWTGDGGCGAPVPGQSANGPTFDDPGAQIQNSSGDCGGNRGGLFREYTFATAGNYVVNAAIALNSNALPGGWFEMHANAFTGAFAGNMNGDGNGFAKYDSSGTTFMRTTNNPDNGRFHQRSSPVMAVAAAGKIRVWLKHGGAIGGTRRFDYIQIARVTDTIPTVPSIVLVSPSPNNLASVQFNVNFSESMTGGAISNFALTTTGGITGAMITGVSGSGVTRTVTVNTGTGDGTIRLDVVNSTGLADSTANPLSNVPYTSGPSYTIDKTSPVVQNVSSSTANGAYNVPDVIAITVQFSEEVMVSGTPQLTLETGAVDRVANYSSGISDLIFLYTVQAGDTSADLDYVGTGSLMLNGGSIRDTVTNNANLTLAAPGASGSLSFNKDIVIDTTNPLVSSIVRADANPTNAGSVNFTVTFNEPTQPATVNIADFTVTPVGVTGATVTGVSGTGPYTVTVSTGTGDGSIRLDLLPAATVSDTAGNDYSATFNTGEVYTIDKTNPIVLSIVRASSNPTNAASVDFTLTFDEPTQPGTVDITDFTLDVTGTIAGATVTNVTGTGPYTVTVNTGTGDGTINLFVLGLPATILDLAGNDYTANFASGEIYTIDKSLPSVTVEQAGAQADPTNTLPIVFDVVFSEPVTGFDQNDVAMGGTATGVTFNVAGSGPYTINVTAVTGDGTLVPSVNAAGATDAVGNGNQASTSADNSVTYDTTAPAVTVEQAGAQADPTNTLPIVFDVVFSEPVTLFDDGDINMGGTATGVTYNVAGSGSYTINVTAITGSGTVVPTVNATAGIDGAGNPSQASTSVDNSVLYDGVPPAVLTENPARGTTRNNLLNVAVTFTEPVVNVTAANLTVNSIAATSVTGSGAGPYTFSGYTAPGSGTANVSLLSGTIQDNVGNAFAGDAWTYTIDTTVPVVQAAVPSPNSAVSSIPSVTVTFTRSVVGVTAADLTVDGSPATSVIGTASGPYVFSGFAAPPDGPFNVILAAGAIEDTLGNDFPGDSWTCTMDSTAPDVVSVVRIDPSPTSAFVVSYTVNFSENVTGVDVTDFDLATTGAVSGAFVSGLSGGPGAYTVDVNTGSGSGTLRLDVLADGSIQDGLGHALSGPFTGGQVYTINKAVLTSAERWNLYR